MTIRYWVTYCDSSLQWSEHSGPRMRAWVRIPLLTQTFYVSFSWHRWKNLRCTNPETLNYFISNIVIDCWAAERANLRTAQNKYWAIGCQDLYFLNFVACTKLSNVSFNDLFHILQELSKDVFTLWDLSIWSIILF